MKDDPRRRDCRRVPGGWAGLIQRGIVSDMLDCFPSTLATDAFADVRFVLRIAGLWRRAEPFRAVGVWYDDFTQTEDDEVRALLAAARGTRTGSPARTP